MAEEQQPARHHFGIQGLKVWSLGFEVYIAFADGRMRRAKHAMKNCLPYAGGSCPNWPFEFQGVGFGGFRVLTN